MNIVPSHARGKVAVDKIFGAGTKARQAVSQFGRDKVINGAQGVLLDENEKLVCLPTVEKVLRNLSTEDLVSYAPIRGLPEFLHDIIDITFDEYKPEAYIQSVATAGGAGALHHTIWNYSNMGDTILTSDWFWSPYRVLCQEALRKLDAFALFDADLKFNLEDFKNKTSNLLKAQDNVLVILNTPAHNPTGYSLSGNDWDKILTVCKGYAKNRDKKITLLIDAAYLDYTGGREGKKFFEKFANLPANILVILAISMSKSYTFYGQRTGAMIGISADKEAIEEFVNVNEYTSRATWSNINRGAMKTLATIYRDKSLLRDVQRERTEFLKIIEKRARLLMTEARQVKLETLPYIAGFFASIPAAKPDEICDQLNKDNIFLVPLDKGVRIAVCAIPSNKIPGLAAKIKKAMTAAAQG